MALNGIIKIKTSSFELNKLITTKQLYSKVDLMLSARLVLRCIVDYWNNKLFYSYPTQKTIALATGLSVVSVVQAVTELENKQLILKQKQHKRIYYVFTSSFFNYLGLLPQPVYANGSMTLNNLAQGTLQNNILKEKENTYSSSQNLNEQLSDVEFAKIFISRLGHLPQFRAKAESLKSKYNI